MERQQELKVLLKRWEAEFLRERRRKPSQADIEEAPEETQRLYREYRQLKRGRGGAAGTGTEHGQTEGQAQDSGFWGSHLNRAPRAPGRSRARSPRAGMTELYGIRLRARLGTAAKVPPLTPNPRRTPKPPRARPTPQLGAETPSENPEKPENSQKSPELLLAPGTAPNPDFSAVAEKFRRLRRNVGRTLRSLDPAWIRRCQEFPEKRPECRELDPESLGNTGRKQQEFRESSPKSLGNSGRKQRELEPESLGNSGRKEEEFQESLGNLGRKHQEFRESEPESLGNLGRKQREFQESLGNLGMKQREFRELDPESLGNSERKQQEFRESSPKSLGNSGRKQRELEPESLGNLGRKEEEFQESLGNSGMKQQEFRELSPESLGNSGRKQREFQESLGNLERKQQEFRESLGNLGRKEEEFQESLGNLERKQWEFRESSPESLGNSERKQQEFQESSPESLGNSGLKQREFQESLGNSERKQREFQESFRNLGRKEDEFQESLGNSGRKQQEFRELDPESLGNSGRKQMELDPESLGNSGMKQREFRESLGNSGMKQREFWESLGNSGMKQQEFQESLGNSGRKQQEFQESLGNLERKQREFRELSPESLGNLGMKQREFRELDPKSLGNWGRKQQEFQESLGNSGRKEQEFQALEPESLENSGRKEREFRELDLESLGNSGRKQQEFQESLGNLGMKQREFRESSPKSLGNSGRKQRELEPESLGNSGRKEEEFQESLGNLEMKQREFQESSPESLGNSGRREWEFQESLGNLERKQREFRELEPESLGNSGRKQQEFQESLGNLERKQREFRESSPESLGNSRRKQREFQEFGPESLGNLERKEEEFRESSPESLGNLERKQQEFQELDPESLGNSGRKQQEFRESLGNSGLKQQEFRESSPESLGNSGMKLQEFRESLGNRGRKRPRDAAGAAGAAAKLRRGSEPGISGPRPRREEEEEEEEEAPKAARRARAPARNRGNYVRLNLKRKTYTRGSQKGKFLRKQVWKQKWRKKFGGGGDLCFRCGGKGHWASECPGKDLGLFPPEIPQDEEKVLLTLEEAAQRTNGDFIPEIPDGSTTENSQLPSTSLDFPQPEFSPSPPIDPLYPPNPDGTIPDPPEEVLEALRILGYDSFRPGQAEAIMRVLSGISTLLLLPTGSGKSLCYQLPAFLYHRRSRCISLVISPLVSLMDDQVSGLPSALKAVCLHSNLTQSQREAAIKKVRSGQAQILLVSPESVTGSGFFCRLFRHFPPVAFACLDEAHCISQWSHNFRPAYLRVCKVLRERLGIRCFLGLTATATVATVRDVAEHLGILDGKSVVGGFGIPENLRLSVSVEADQDRAVLRLLREWSLEDFGNSEDVGNSVIVYCLRREESERLAELIRAEFPEVPGKTARKGPVQVAAAYHAGLSGPERRRILRRFAAGGLWALCGTAALGLGLHPAPLRAVLLAGGAPSLAAFLQRVGRAGTDGRDARGHLCLRQQEEDFLELRRHIHENSVDFWVVKTLIRKVFAPCKCLEKQENSQEIPGSPRRCRGHERSLPVEELEQELDLKQEGLETLLSELELHPERCLRLLPPAPTRCRLRPPRDSPDCLRRAAQRCPPLAFLLSQGPSGIPGFSGIPGIPGSLEFDAAALSEAMGWELPRVTAGLGDIASERGRSSGIQVEFQGLSFRFRARGDLSPRDLDSLAEFLHSRGLRREKAELRRLQECFRTFRTVAAAPAAAQDGLLRELLRERFLTQEEEEEEEEEKPGIPQEEEEEIRAEIRKLLEAYPEERFTGRAVARIFHGIGSPRFPAPVFGRDRRFWRHLLGREFRGLARLAALEILARR